MLQREGLSQREDAPWSRAEEGGIGLEGRSRGAGVGPCLLSQWLLRCAKELLVQDQSVPNFVLIPPALLAPYPHLSISGPLFLLLGPFCLLGCGGSTILGGQVVADGSRAWPCSTVVHGLFPCWTVNPLRAGSRSALPLGSHVRHEACNPWVLTRGLRPFWPQLLGWSRQHKPELALLPHRWHGWG